MQLDSNFSLNHGYYDAITQSWHVQSKDLSDLKIVGDFSSALSVTVQAVSIDNIGSEKQMIHYDRYNLNNVTLSNNLDNLGFKITGQIAYDFVGQSVSNAGDVNGDGIDDLIVGAYSHDGKDVDSGAAYVIYGGRDLQNITLSDNLGDLGFKIAGQAAGDYAGSSVSTAGDVNGDGIDDLIVKAGGNGTSPGTAYVIYGGHDLHNITLSNDLGTLGFNITSQANGDITDFSVSNAGDINGDGFADLIVGTPTGDGNGSYSGTAYVIYGGRDLHNITLSNNLGDLGFKIVGQAAGDGLGFSVSNAGDVNGDGMDDLIVGAPTIVILNKNLLK